MSDNPSNNPWIAAFIHCLDDKHPDWRNDEMVICVKEQLEDIKEVLSNMEGQTK